MPEDKIFVCDADGVLLDTETAFRACWGKLLNVDIPEGAFVHWEHARSLGVTEESTAKFWETFWLETELEPYPIAGWFTRTVRKYGYRLYILSSRSSRDARHALLRDLQKGRLEFDDILICDHRKENKSSYINKLPNAKYFLDDHIKNTADVQMHCSHLLRVMLLDRDWNKSLDLSGYLRVFSYEDVLAELYKS